MTYEVTCIWPDCKRRAWGVTEKALQDVLNMMGYVRTRRGWVCSKHVRMAGIVHDIIERIP